MLSKIINSLLNGISHSIHIGDKHEIYQQVWFIGEESFVPCPDPFLTHCKKDLGKMTVTSVPLRLSY